MHGLREIDRILRGDATSAPDLCEKGLTFHLGHVIIANLLLAACAGLCLGMFGITGREEPEFRFMLADAVKVPLLFLLSLIITFPSLYVFNALVGSPLGAAQLSRLLAAAVGVLMAVLAAFGPIVAFFSISSTSYPFILLLNVAIFVMAGAFGMTFLWKTMVKLTIRIIPPRPVEGQQQERVATESTGGQAEPQPGREREEDDLPRRREREDDEPNPRRRVREDDYPERRRQRDRDQSKPVPIENRMVTIVFRVWLVAFALVGTQMSWVLRPFIGAPNREFAWFRPRSSSFIEAVIAAIRQLFA